MALRARSLAVWLVTVAGAYGVAALTMRSCGRRPEGAAAITAPTIARHVGVLAHDSMVGRDTPSPGLEAAANYVAARFARAGLESPRDGWRQRYPVYRRRFEVGEAWFSLRGSAGERRVALDPEGALLRSELPATTRTGPVVVLGGGLTPEAVRGLDVTGWIVLAVGSATRRPPAFGAALLALAKRHPLAIVGINDATVQRMDSLRRVRPPVTASRSTGEDAVPLLVFREEQFRPVLRGAGVSPEALRASEQPVILHPRGLAGTVHLPSVVLSPDSAPNVIGLLRGGDPALRDEWVVISAHMDHIGRAGPGADSIYNGADDNASGTAALLELAAAFGAEARSPRRSLLFVAVSGEEKDLWGSEYFLGHAPVPLNKIVANLNIDMIGRNAPDTVAIIGGEHSSIGEVADSTAQAHQELGLVTTRDPAPGLSLFTRSDHFNFARRGIPAIFIFSGVHADYHQVTDEPSRLDAEKAARVARLVYHVATAIANSPRRPSWNPASRASIVEPTLDAFHPPAARGAAAPAGPAADR